MISDSHWWEPLKYLTDELTVHHKTPCFVYSDERIRHRVKKLNSLLGNYFTLNYAVKANSNKVLLETYNEMIGWFDASSIGEVTKAVNAGAAVENISFTGPAKKKEEIESAITQGIGGLVIESLREAETANNFCQRLGRRQSILIRINPEKTPKHFSARMSGKSSQFGIDQSQLEVTLESISKLKQLDMIGFHIYNGSNCLSAESIAENFSVMTNTFSYAAKLAKISPQRLIFGSAFGVPYYANENKLDVEKAATSIKNIMDEFKSSSTFKNTHCSLELGRWLVAPCGLLLTTVVSSKDTPDCSIRLCDAGFNNHLAACGLMGSVIRRNWAIENLSNGDSPTHKYTLVGPLCTSIDLLASDIELPETNVDDLLAIPMSGAYAYSASPVNFISHPDPAEILIKNGKAISISNNIKGTASAEPRS